MDIIVDSSVWIDFFNYYESKEADALQYLVENNFNNNIYIFIWRFVMKRLGNMGGNVTRSFTGSMYSDSYVGGIVGKNNYGSIENCYSTGNISGTGASTLTNAYVGGISGNVNPTTYFISYCYATGNIESNGFTPYAGGIAGGVGAADAVKNCVALNGEVSVSSGSNIGRVYSSTYTGMNNHANAAMVDGALAILPSGALTTQDGQNVALDENSGGAYTQAFWTTTVVWTPVWSGVDDNHPWNWGDNNLPMLYWELYRN
jgi:hypothetical protein